MTDYYARRIIEALRSGISSREVGQCFSSARPKIMGEIYGALGKLAEDGRSGGLVITGKYGEGKTHLLNSVFNMAREQNMVVSLISLSKETPLSSLTALYQKALQNAYLPGRSQPGLLGILDNLTKGAAILPELYEYCLTGLETNRLYYVLKSYVGTADDEEKYALLGDIEGEFLTNSRIRQIYNRIYDSPATYNVRFAKTKHTQDYFAFLSRLFLALGYRGWVLLFDEAELMGRLGKRTRLHAYENMARLLRPAHMEAAFSIFAFNASYLPDVIGAKQEEANLAEAPLAPEAKALAAEALERIMGAPQLVPLERGEILDILGKIQRYHGAAYGWQPPNEPESLYAAVEKHGYLLRTHIRTAVELLDQQYQYGRAGHIRINELGRESFDGETESLEEFAAD